MHSLDNNHTKYCIYCSFKLINPDLVITNNNIEYIIKLSNLFNFNKLKHFNNNNNLITINKNKIINKIKFLNSDLIPNNIYNIFILNYNQTELNYSYILNLLKLLSKQREDIIITINHIYLNCLFNIKNKLENN